MTVRMRGFRAAARSASGFARAVTVAGIIAGLLLVASEFSTVAWVDVAGGSCKVINDADPQQAARCDLTGFDRNAGAFLILGALAGAMAWGAGVGGSRPAAMALLAIGAIVVVLSLARDLPETHRTGEIGVTHEDAKGKAGAGLFLELVGGGLAVGAGLLRLTRRPDS